MLQTKEEIIKWLEEKAVTTNRIVVHPNLTVDILGSLLLHSQDLNDIPITFNIIDGDFYCSYNNLKSLPICKEVKGELIAEGNKISSLENFPIVHHDINLSNNELTDLKGLPPTINGSLYVFNNKLTSLEGCPEMRDIEDNDFGCSNNLLISLKYAPSLISGRFNCSNNPLQSLEYCPTYIGENLICKNVAFNVLHESLDHLIINGNIQCDIKNDIHHELEAFYEEDMLDVNKNLEINISLKELIQYQLKQKIEKNFIVRDKIIQPKI